MTRKPLDRYNSADIAQLVREDTHYMDCDSYPKLDLGSSPFARANDEDRGRKFARKVINAWVTLCAFVGAAFMSWHLAAWLFG